MGGVRDRRIDGRRMELPVWTRERPRPGGPRHLLIDGAALLTGPDAAAAAAASVPALSGALTEAPAP
jgi:hypothetical protein